MSLNGGATEAPFKYLSYFMVAAMLAGLLALGLHYGPAGVHKAIEWVHSLGPLAYIAFVLLNVLCTLLCVPQSPLSIAAGLLFGWKIGTLLAVLGMTLGGCCAFLATRTVLHDRVHAAYADQILFIRLRDALREHPLHAMAMARLVPVFHFSLTSYLLGLTDIRFSIFCVMSALCMIPETLFLASGSHFAFASFKSGHIMHEAGLALIVALVLLLAGLAYAYFRNRKA